MKIERLELRLLKLPLVHFFETSFGRIHDAVDLAANDPILRKPNKSPT